MRRFLDIAKNRYSCRKYDVLRVEEEKLMLVLEAGRVAPSAVNFQPWHFYVMQETDDLERFYGAYHREWFRTAPCVIVICADHSQSWKRKADGKDHGDIDAAITTDHMTLQATELGLATCWICNFDVERTRELLKLPEYLEPVVILPLGYPLDETDPERHSEKRKPLSEIVSYGI
ncbi:MAG: nitroreductase family protein [Bacteroidales bacterium]|nr:nitroreductase family protein [Bacteroidales bacterium]